MKRLLLAIASLSMVAASGLGVTAIAAPPSPDNPKGPSSDVMGVVHAKNTAKPGGGAGGNLAYHGGPVMHTNTVYAIYWVPDGFTMDTRGAGYNGVIDSYLQDVAAASSANTNTNVYYSDTQYYDANRVNILYSSTFGGSVVDTNPYPASGCTDSVTATTVCLSDSQLRGEIDQVAHAQGWPRTDALFFMFTAKGVGSCYSSSSCAFSSYCAYHSNFTSQDGMTLYANQPYASTVKSACDPQQYPNGNEADATINVASHEHNEAITDPLGNAWYDKRGYENGDKCAWTFGATLGPAGGRYNQVINTHHYYLQQEWSNKTARCVLQGL